MLKNSDGRRDGSWTLAVVSVTIFQISTLLGGSEWSQGGGWVLRIPTPGETSVAAVMTTVVAYVWRRTKRKKEE